MRGVLCEHCGMLLLGVVDVDAIDKNAFSEKLTFILRGSIEAFAQGVLDATERVIGLRLAPAVPGKEEQLNGIADEMRASILTLLKETWGYDDEPTASSSSERPRPPFGPFE